mmetsp:Transcript_26566/g.73039  ORF Transcript_26566/g.73039 Transcript_26566/m.73039 type:complete len:1927 (+) Transcript_26566:220-6000(+)|eukprot:CAMPEP_0172363750 /NCGR_PEP_ID=MMETSP1060-20121228/7023_1 /TAXON_ID=37318 /ORGANISM="Pseudo-nitzschia pungens, Strain cf. cingulata" /LENGTH=1926 /DNA_ID=CAMNT_0013086561 /DNA_START=231 /DNA_END=6011 /DNA_ORIENTATION=-
MPKSEISEESFSTLLKRIERQYGGNSSSSSGRRNAPIPATRQRWIQRPPDEAAYALGKGLAHSFLDLLARTKFSTLSNEISQELFALLASRDGNPAVSQGFFDHLLWPPEEKHSGIGVVDLDAFFPACILFAEQNEVLRQNSFSDDEEDDNFNASFDPLTCMIRSYAGYTCLKCQRESNDRDAMLEEKPLSSSSTKSIAKTYSKLQTQAGRLAMLRDFTNRAFSGPRRNHSCFQNVYRCMLTPLLTCGVLSSQTACSNGGDSSMTEAIFCVEGIWRQTYVLVEDALTVHDEGFVLLYSLVGVIEWLTEMLNLYLLSIPVQKRRFRISSKELTHRWLSMVLDVGVLLAESLEEDGHEEQRQKLMDWFESILSTSLLRWFAAVPTYRIQIGPLLVSIQRLMEIYGSRCALSLESTLKLATIAICQPAKRDTRELLGLLAEAVEQAQQLHPIGFSILKGLASIFSSDPICAATTKTLQRALIGAKDKKHEFTTSKSSSEILVNLIQLFEDGKSIDTIMSYFLSHQDDMFDAKNTFSPIQQAGSLTLFGIGLLNEDASHCRIACMFLKKLLLVYPHLGITVLPVVVDSINVAAVRGDGDSMMEQIEFLAEVVVRDPQCARETWNLLGKEFMRDSVPAVIRSSIIRLFPKVCQGNKKLYKRVIESMGDTLVNTSNNDGNENDALEIRLAIAASTADLAREGFIRDPTDIISWIQDFITDTGWVRPVSTIHQQRNEHGKAAMVHFSILALHHLVIAQELDFKLVLVVLGKKLCDVHNLEEVSKLPLIVLESLILLLGDGESEEEDSSDEDDDRLKAIGVSLQTSRSVDTLIGLWNHDCLRVERFSESIAKVTLFRCKTNILNSLTKYSFEALGVDEDGIQTVVAAALHETDDKSRNMMQTGVRYNALKHIMGDGIELLSTIHRRRGILLDQYQVNCNAEILDEFSVSLSGFISKIIKLEEDTLGSSLWQKRQHANAREKKQKGKRKGSSQRAKLSEVLPSPKSVLVIYEDNRCQASALGALLSFEGKPSSILFDLAMDATSDPSDAIFQTFFVQSWLNAARSILLHLASTRSISAALDKLLNDIEECRLDNPDSMFMLSSSIAILIPTVLGSHGDFTSYTKDILTDVWDAYNSHIFEDSDIAKLCLGFVGVCDVTLGTNDRLLQIVDTLEKTATGYGGSPSFGAYYGLAIIAQTLASSRKRKAIESQYSSDMEELPGRIIIFLLNELSKCTTGMQVPLSILASSIQNMTITSEEVDTLNQLQRSSLKVKKSKLRTSKSIFIALGICFSSVSTMDKNLVPPIISFLESFEWGCGVGFCLGPLLKACRDCNLMNDGEVEKKCDGYSESFEKNIGKDVDTLHDILSTITAVHPKSSSSSSIEKMRMMEDARNGRSSSLVLAVSSISAIPCLGHGMVSNCTNSPCLKENANDTDVAAVVQFVSEETDDMAMIMNGFLASLTMSDGSEENSKADVDNRFSGTKLPEAHLGTCSEILVSSLNVYINEHNDSGLVALLRCFEVIALPDQFSSLVETLTNGQESIKTACVKLLISQIKGRPRAIFDGRDFVKLALKICKMPPMSVRNILGNDEAAEIFISAFGDMLTKFLSHEVEVVIENVFRFCVNHFDRNSTLVTSFLQSMERVLHQAEHDKSPRFSPKCLKSIQLFLQQKSFPGIQDTASTNVPPNRITKVVESYADCVVMIPETLLIENKGEIFSTQSNIGFKGEVLRIRVMMNLIRNGRCVLFSHSYREIASSMAWLSQQMIACREDVFSPAILQVACTIAEASSNETPDKKRDILVSFLDNILMVDSNASFVCLEIIAALVYQWCQGSGSDGDLSLLRALGPSIEKWVDLCPEALKQTFQLAVHDLPFNLAKFARNGNLSGVIFNRLWRIYTKWLEQGADINTLTALRLSLLCCPDTETGTNVEDIVALVSPFP